MDILCAIEQNTDRLMELGQESLESRLEAAASSSQRLSVNDLKNVHWSLVSIVCGLHSAGFVHLDIKPSNIVRFGEAWKLINFDGCKEAGTTVDSSKVMHITESLSAMRRVHRCPLFNIFRSNNA